MPFIAVSLSYLQVGDLAYLLRAGQTMWNTSSVLRTELFTYTIPGAPWLNQQWGAELVFAAWHQAAGWKGLMLLQAIVVAGCFGSTYRLSVSNGASAIVAAISTVVGFGVAALLPGSLALRPQLLALPLFMLSVWIVRARHGHPRRLLMLIPIGVTWANVHGSFVLLSVILLIALACDVITRSRVSPWVGGALAASIVTPVVSPWGWGTYRYVWDVAHNPVVQEITEWLPIVVRQPAGTAFVLVCAFTLSLLIARHTRWPSLEEWLLLALFTALAVWSGRNVLWWAVAVPQLIAGPLAGWDPGSAWPGRAAVIVRLAIVGVMTVALLRVAITPTADLRSEAPAGITAWLAARPSSGSHVFAEWWGQWFEYAVPEEPMFVDSRIELFPPAVWTDYDTVVEVRPGWLNTLDRWDVDTVIVARGHHPALDLALRSSAGWTVAYEDVDGIVFTRA